MLDGVSFPEEVFGSEDLWMTCLLIAKARSASVIGETLYNYRIDNPVSISNNASSRRYYWSLRALLRGLEMARERELIATEDDYRVAHYAVSALLAHKRDGLLSPEMYAEVAARVNLLKDTVARMDPRARYGTYHSLSRCEKAFGRRGKAGVYLCEYLFAKARYLMGKAFSL